MLRRCGAPWPEPRELSPDERVRRPPRISSATCITTCKQLLHLFSTLMSFYQY